MSQAPKPALPRGVDAECRAWYRRMLTEYNISDEGGITLLQLAVLARQRMRSAAAAVEREGMTLADGGGRVKAHPLLAVERDARAQMLAALRQLRLDVEPLRPAPGRPGGT